MKEIETPFGSKDSELYEATYHIPEGMEAVIEGDKVVIRKKENEDERIRKALVEYFKHVRYNGLDLKTTNVDEVLDWLEEQGEQNTVNQDLEDKEETIVYQGEVYTRVYRDELDKFACKYPKTIPLPSKKYRKYSETDLVIAVKAGAEWKMKQKPIGWSEEDETKLQDVLWCINKAKQNAKDENEMGTCWCAERWLKSLKDRFSKEPANTASTTDGNYSVTTAEPFSKFNT